MKIFLIRIIACYILSILVGFERQVHNKVTGLRTNVLVSLGAFLFVYFSFGSNGITGDQARIASQVVSGIGFLGAGVIIRNGSKIKGLNTAATLWCVEAIGVLCAGGMIVEAAIGTYLVLFSNILLRVISSSIMKKVRSQIREKCVIRIECDKEVEKVVRARVVDNIEKNSLKMEGLLRNKSENGIKLKFEILTTRPDVIEDLVRSITEEVGVNKISWTHHKITDIDQDSDDEYEEEDE